MTSVEGFAQRCRTEGPGLGLSEGLLRAYQTAYQEDPLRIVEGFIHEIAHIVAIGDTPSTDVPGQIQEWLDRMSKPMADTWEVDASVVTFLTGEILGFWDDPVPIKKSCDRNTGFLNINPIWSLARVDSRNIARAKSLARNITEEVPWSLILVDNPF